MRKRRACLLPIEARLGHRLPPQGSRVRDGQPHRCLPIPSPLSALGHEPVSSRSLR